MTKITEIDACPITGDSESVTFINFGDFPLVNNLNDSRDASINCERYPLKVNYYPSSRLAALSHAVDSSLLFSNYLYKTSVITPYIEHCINMFTSLSDYVSLDHGDLMIDIGGNDGTLLSTFKQNTDLDLEYLNIDGSQNLTQESISKGIPAQCDFFSLETSKKVQKKAKVITSTNVFQHLKDTNSFVQGVENLLLDNGIWLLEFPYWINCLETNQFDQIYHEHMYYYCVYPLRIMMEKHGLKVIDVIPKPIHGGSLRLIIAKQESHFKAKPVVDEYLQNETIYDIDYYHSWGKKVWDHLEHCQRKLTKLKELDKTIIGFSASAKGCIFLNATGLDYRTISLVIDDTQIKQNKYIPGTGIEIVDRETANLSSIDYILLLSHNLKDHIMNSLRQDGYGGQFIVCLPNFEII